MRSIEDWSTACPDWADRIARRKSLVPDGLPIDAERAARAVRIFGRLRLVDVPGKPRMRDACEPWVFDFVRVIFGAQDTELRRQLIREFFVCVAKKNGKSSFAAGIMLTALIMNERAQGEYLILAPTKDVADNSFLPAYGMVKADEALFKRYKPSDTTREIVDRLDGSVLAVKSADADVVGGQKAIGIFVDELWLFGKKASAENILSEATGSLAARPEGFVIYASTQSDDQPAGVFKKKLQYYRSVRDGEIKDRASLPLIYEYPQAMQKAEAWNDPATWYIPNPSLGRSVDPEWLQQKLTEKQHEGRESLQLFLAKHFNIEVGIGFRSDRWAGTEFWERQADPEITFESLLERCEVIVVGIDGGGLDDLYGLTVLGREKAVTNGEKRWISWSHAWCDRSVLDRRKSIASLLLQFESDGDLTIIDGDRSDMRGIAECVERVKDAGLLHCVAVDPWGLGSTLQFLSDIGVSQENKSGGYNFVIGVPQGQALISAIKQTERNLACGLMLHADQPMMDWAVGNVKIEATATSIRMTKQNAGDAKFDPVAALINAAQVMSMNPSLNTNSGWNTDDLDALMAKIDAAVEAGDALDGQPTEGPSFPN